MWSRICLILLLLMGVGCRPESPSNPTTLIIFAASSLSDAFDELGQAFEAQHPGLTLLFNFASSSELAVQLNEGATADLFASANNQQMQNVIDTGRITLPPSLFLTNQLILIVPTNNPAGINELADLARPGIALISATPGVPIRVFSEQMLDKAAADPAYGSSFKANVLANLVSEEANVRQVVAKVALGEADAGLVYQSDVTPDLVSQLQTIEIPPAFNILAVYPIGRLADAPNPILAQQFIDFVLSEPGQAILASWGFGPRPE